MRFLSALLTTTLKLSLIFVLSLSSQAQGWRKGEMEIKVFLNDKQDAKTLHNLGINGDIYRDHALMYVISEELDALKNTGLNYQITKADLNAYSENFWQNRDAYHTSDEIIAIMDSLVDALPQLVSKTVYGTSVGGRELSALKISDNVSVDENEAEIGFDGNIHGDEIGGGENMIRLARWLCQQYQAGNPQINDLVNNREIWIYTLANPDGRENLTRYNNNGIDLNRDWGFNWNGEGSSPGPYSQPESKSLRQMMLDNQFAIHMTLHSGIEMYLHPWYFYEVPCPDIAEEIVLADMYASTSGYGNLTTGPGTSLYPTTGSTAESYYGVKGSHGIVMELSSNKQPPSSQIGYYFDINLQPSINLIQYAGYGLQGLITDAQSGDPVAAVIYVGDKMTCYSDPVVGDYHKFVTAGTYTVKVKANGYQTQIISNVSVENLATTTLDIQMEATEEQSIYQVCASQRPSASSSHEQASWDVIGPPDNLYYSLGKNGWMVFDMQYLVLDGAGSDIIVFEGDAGDEGFELFAGASIDGPWSSLGTGNGISEFDLSNSTISEARYFKILDDGDGGNEADAGFDLDAVQSMSSIAGPYILLDEYTINDENGNNNGQLDPGETAVLTVTLKNIGTQDATNLFSNLTSDDLYLSVLTGEVQPMGDLQIGMTAQASFDIAADGNTPAGHTATLNLDYYGDDGLSGSKFIDLTFPDYCYPSANCSYGDGFTDFALEAISNLNNDCSNDNGLDGYGNFTDMIANLSPGESYTLQWETGYSDQYASLWIDFNDDKEFDNDEMLIDNFHLSNDGQLYNTDFEIPEMVPAGEHRLRIRAHWQEPASDPCSSYSYGETEDYTVVIEQGNTILPEFEADINEFCGAGTVQFTDLSQGNVSEWLWQFPGGQPESSSEQNPQVLYESAGSFDVTLSVSNATFTESLTMDNYIAIHELPEVSLEPFTIFCLQWPPYQLVEGLPEGGIYSGPGVIDGWFHPEIADLGEHEISYTYTDENGCTNFASQMLVVDACTGLAESALSFSIFPNPSHGIFTLVSPFSDSDVRILVKDDLGNTVYQKQGATIVAGQGLIIRLDKPVPGLYFIIIEASHRMVKKVMVE